MQQTDDISAEDELIRLLLKRQTELNALLEITQAINKDTGTPIKKLPAGWQAAFPNRKRWRLCADVEIWRGDRAYFDAAKGLP